MNKTTPCIKCNKSVKPQNEYIVALAAKHGMICRSCRFSNQWTKATYREYLNSEQWRTRRARAISKANGRCQICASCDTLQVHHNNYDRLGHEVDSDLVVLCEHHHRMVHGLLTYAEYGGVVRAWGELEF